MRLKEELKARHKEMQDIVDAVKRSDSTKLLSVLILSRV